MFNQKPVAQAVTLLLLAVLHVYVAPGAAFVSVVQAVHTSGSPDAPTSFQNPGAQALTLLSPVSYTHLTLPTILLV